MAESRIPHEWVGGTVVVGLLEPASESLQFGSMSTAIRLPATAVKVGTLVAVTGLGIVGAFTAFGTEEEEPVGFYPWSAVLSIMPAQGSEVAEVRPIR